MNKMVLLVLLTVSFLPVDAFGQPVRHPLAIKHVTIIDTTGAPAKRDMTVVLVDGQIVSIGKTGKTKIPKGARRIDATGKFLIPAFWDMHVHFFDADRTLPLFVANGVLGVRELGGPMDDVMKWRAEAAANKIVSPRIVTAGRILDGDPPSSRPEYAEVVKNADEARHAVDKLAARGVDLIKVYDALSRDAYLAIAHEAKKLGLPFGGHTPTAITTLEASDAGKGPLSISAKSLKTVRAIGQKSTQSKPKRYHRTTISPSQRGSVGCTTQRSKRIASRKQRRSSGTFAGTRRGKFRRL